MPYGPVVKTLQTQICHRCIREGLSTAWWTEQKWAPLHTLFVILGNKETKEEKENSSQRLQVKRELEVRTVTENQAGADRCWAETDRTAMSEAES